MNAEISFGEMRQSEPQRGLRPDHNPQFAAAWVGEPSPEEMAVFVDWDTLVELESHALSDTTVELGGVLLGRQQVDESGKPFVVIFDSIRAEHYQATRGSFKFTHETWEAISRRRAAYPGDTTMVGWYHTHPDWSVFLSGMDMFICDHFFNAPQDVALVIDPVRNDRGWFVWTGDSDRPIVRTRGFCLTAHRTREQEVQQAAEYYNEVMSMTADTKFVRPTAATAPVVHIHERSQSTAVTAGMFALVTILIVQITATTMMLWQGNRNSDDSLRSQVAALVDRENARVQADVYRQMLVALVEKDVQTTGLIDQWTAIDQENRQLRTSLDGYVAVTEKLKTDQADLTGQLDVSESKNKQLRSIVATQKDQIETLKSDLKSAEADSPTRSIWWTIGLGSLAVALLAGVGVAGFCVGQRRGPQAE